MQKELVYGKFNHLSKQCQIFANIREECKMYLKSENNTSMVCSETTKMKKCLYNLMFVNYNENMSENIKSSDFAFDYTGRLYCSCHKITLSCG